MTHARAPHIGIDLPAVLPGAVATRVRFPALKQVTAEQIDDLFQQVGIAVNELDPEQDGGEITARLGAEFDIIDVDLAQGKDRVFGNSHGAFLPRSMAYRRDRPQTPGTAPILGLAELTEFTVLQTLSLFWHGH